MATDRMRLRELAVQTAVSLSFQQPQHLVRSDYDGPGDLPPAIETESHRTLEHQVREVLHAATDIYAWLIQPRVLAWTWGPIVDRATGAVITPAQGANMANPQLGDAQQITATVTPDDAAGYATTDTLAWTASDETAVSLTPSADTLSCVIDGLVPTAGVVITATDPNGVSITGDVDVVAGQASTLTMSFGTPTDRTQTEPTDPGTGDTTGTDTAADGTDPSAAPGA